MNYEGQIALVTGATRGIGAAIAQTLGAGGATVIGTIREALVQQLYKPVRWVACVQALKARGAKMLIEMGPGKVLTGLTRRIDKSLSAQPLFDASGLAKILNLS